jgi:hypothetical protein
MPKLNDGNETYSQIRPGAAAIPGTLGGGTQTDLAASKPISSPVNTATSKTKFSWLDPTVSAALCSTGLYPRAIDQILMRVLTSHFLDATYLFNTNLNYLVFNENQAQGKIRIALHTNFDASAADKIPAIVIKRGNTESTRLSMGDEGAGTNLATSVYQYARRIRGQHQLVVLSSVDGEAEDLGMEVFDTLSTASPLLVSRYPFADFQVTGITELQIMSELGNRYGVIVTTQYDYEYGWKVTLGDDIAPLVTGFNVNTTFVAQ